MISNGAWSSCPDSRRAALPPSQYPRRGGEETPSVLVHCRTSDNAERSRLRDEIRDKVRSITGMNCVVELVPPRTLPRTSSGKLSRSKARNLYLSGEIQPYDVAA